MLQTGLAMTRNPKQEYVRQLTLEGWVSYFQGEVSALRNIRLGISGLVLSVSAIMVSIVIAFVTDILLVYTAIVTLALCAAGSLYVGHLGLRKERIEEILEEILRGRLASSKAVQQKWLKLYKRKGHRFFRR